MTDQENPVRFRHLQAMGKAPQVARWMFRGGEGDSTTSLERGTAVHAILFGTKTVVPYPGAQRRGKEWEAFEAMHRGDVILTKAEYDKAVAMADSVRANPEAVRLLTGTRETSINWHIGGRACLSTPDVVGDRGEFITELKTCQSAHPERFRWHAIRYHYHAQLAWYASAVEASRDVWSATPKLYIVAVESSPPYPVTVFRLSDAAVEAGHKLWHSWWERLRNCEETGEWPGYAQGIVDLDVPEEEPELVFATEAA